MINLPSSMSAHSALSPLAPLTTLPPATQKYAEIQLDMVTEIARKMIFAVEQVVNLQLHFSKETLEESSSTLRHCLYARQSQEMMSVVTGQLEPASRKALLYCNQLMEIITSTQAALASVVESHFNEAGRSVEKLVADMTDVARKTGYARSVKTGSQTEAEISTSTPQEPATHAVVVSQPGQQSPTTT